MYDTANYDPLASDIAIDIIRDAEKKYRLENQPYMVRKRKMAEIGLYNSKHIRNRAYNVLNQLCKKGYATRYEASNNEGVKYKIKKP